MAKQSNTIGHILIELNTAVNVTCHWSDKNRVQGKSPLKPFECVYIAPVWKFFAPSASDIFFLLFLHTILFTVENTCRTLTIVVRNLTHVHTQAHPLCTFFLGSGRWVSFPNPYTGECLKKLLQELGSSHRSGTRSSGSAAGSVASRHTQVVEYRPLLLLKQDMYLESRIRSISSGAQHIWIVQGIAYIQVQRVKIPIKTEIKRFFTYITWN